MTTAGTSGTSTSARYPFRLAKPLSAAVVGATGYTGSEVCRLLAGHPTVEVTVATSERQDGESLSSACPWLTSNLKLTSFDASSIEADVIFLCQSNGFAMNVAPELAHRMKVIDLSADFRLADTDLYPQWYGFEHACPDLDPWPVYGLPELVPHEEIAGASIIANPGCYVTTALLALVPLKRAGLIEGVPVIDAKSGVSGAGRSRQETEYLLSELHGAMKPYKTTGHRHTPEIEQLFGGEVWFTPHLLPISRGICATIHLQANAGLKVEHLYDCWNKSYSGSKFVRTQVDPPSTKQVFGSNSCVLFADIDDRTGHVVLVSVTDNLVKGAAGQAIQNMNIMLNLPEETGLPIEGVWP